MKKELIIFCHILYFVYYTGYCVHGAYYSANDLCMLSGRFTRSATRFGLAKPCEQMYMFDVWTNHGTLHLGLCVFMAGDQCKADRDWLLDCTEEDLHLLVYSSRYPAVVVIYDIVINLY
jgi:hypothetical protein